MILFIILATVALIQLRPLRAGESDLPERKTAMATANRSPSRAADVAAKPAAQGQKVNVGRIKPRGPQ